MKPLISWNSRDVSSIMVERLGGQGYLSVNRLGECIGFSHSGITAEGDNSVLMQKVAKEYLEMLHSGDYKQPKVFYPRSQILKVTQCDTIHLLRDLMAIREIELANELTELTKSEMM